jgi:hypothetical protein
MKKRDFILIGAILGIIIIVFLAIQLTKEEGASVIVKVNGQEVAEYGLSENGEYELNGGTNILRIEGGKAYLTDADCPDHLCVNQGKISKSGQTITCLPNRLTVTVYSADEGDVELVG